MHNVLIVSQHLYYFYLYFSKIGTVRIESFVCVYIYKHIQILSVPVRDMPFPKQITKVNWKFKLINYCVLHNIIYRDQKHRFCSKDRTLLKEIIFPEKILCSCVVFVFSIDLVTVNRLKQGRYMSPVKCHS